MIPIIEFHGRTAVGPHLKKDGELSAPLEDYFVKPIRVWFAGKIAEKPLWVDDDDPTPFINWWFEQERETLRDVILHFFDYKCMLSSGPVETGEVHELYTRGAASNERALVPWNMIPASREKHDLLQQMLWKVYHYDPLDRESGLICFDTTTHRTPDESLYFYTRPDHEAVADAHARRKMVLEWAKKRIQADWEIAPILAQMRLEKDYKVLGDPSHKAMLSGMQNDEDDDKHFYVDTGLCNSLEKAITLAIEAEAIEDAIFLSPPTAVKIMKRIKDRNEMLLFMRKVSYLSKMDFNKEWEPYKNANNGKEHIRDAIEAVCDCGNASLKVHRHILEDADDQFGMNAQFVIDDGDPVHTDTSKVEVVVDKREE